MLHTSYFEYCPSFDLSKIEITFVFLSLYLDLGSLEDF